MTLDGADGSMAHKVEARAPVRIDLAGGWTDVEPYTHDVGGEVVNLAIDSYARATLEVDDDGILSVNYTCDVAIGSGLGTTGAINVALLAAIEGMSELGDVERQTVAEQAFQFESLLGNKGGRQDQWAAAHGGWNHLLFMGDEVEEMPFNPVRSAERWLNKHLVLANTGITHVSGDLHDSIWQRYADGDEQLKTGLMTIRMAARKMANGLQQDRRDEVISAFNEVCEGVDALDPALHDPFRSVVDPLLRDKNVLGWKALGAGGGGCLVLLANMGRREPVEAACEAAGWTLIEWNLDNEGVVVTAN